MDGESGEGVLQQLPARASPRPHLAADRRFGLLGSEAPHPDCLPLSPRPCSPAPSRDRKSGFLVQAAGQTRQAERRLDPAVPSPRMRARRRPSAPQGASVAAGAAPSHKASQRGRSFRGRGAKSQRLGKGKRPGFRSLVLSGRHPRQALRQPQTPALAAGINPSAQEGEAPLRSSRLSAFLRGRLPGRPRPVAGDGFGAMLWSSAANGNAGKLLATRAGEESPPVTRRPRERCNLPHAATRGGSGGQQTVGQHPPRLPSSFMWTVKYSGVPTKARRIYFHTTRSIWLLPYGYRTMC